MKTLTQTSKDVARSPAPGAAAPSRLATGPPGESHQEDRAELAEVRAQLRELQQAIEAIRTGGVDSLIVGPPGQEQVYALATADRAYRADRRSDERRRRHRLDPWRNPRRKPAAWLDDRPERLGPAGDSGA